MKSQRVTSTLRHAKTALSGAAVPRPARHAVRPVCNNAARYIHGQTARRSSAPSNPAIKFPCLDALETRSATLEQQASTRSDKSGPEPSYTVGATQTYRCSEPLLLDHGGQLHEFDIAYETWGQMNAARSNVILLHTGLSASSHAHSTPENPQPGWWEKFIGPGLALDTDKYFVICTNVIGGCYGSTGPSSIDPLDGERYATRFPILTIQDMVRAQFRLLDHLGVATLYASVGSSMGGMQSLAAGVEFPSRVGRIVSISACARSHPYSIAMRYVQRKAILNDPHWNRGFYYGRVPPHVGMKLAREIATITYRSGPEWEQRFGRRRADGLLYVSKAMDLFDLGQANQQATAARRAERSLSPSSPDSAPSASGTCSLTLPDKPYEEQPQPEPPATTLASPTAGGGAPKPPADLVAGLKTLRNHPVLVLGVASDILFPAWQQREVAEALREAGNAQVEHHELSEVQSLFGHDTFLLDVEGVGGAVRGFLG
ncbi:Alpha/Beta hydrolase protein [Chaetomium sp. MPI-CAGE-AT-0009]|nr:Alpha/Beta hydrolase protein [Chaetomium sp. MPI-CAGE-AT-0009]